MLARSGFQPACFKMDLYSTVLDPFNRRITYLRVSVTDKCDLRCVYCMPEQGVPTLRHEDVLSFEEIEDVVRVAVSLGITKVRITGGEPLVRRDIVRLVSMLSKIMGIHDFAMSTNGQRLESFAQELAGAGLQRVNVSLDSMDPQHYAQITRGGDVKRVIAGINAARRAGLWPIKLNCVIQESPEEKDARSVAAFGRREGLDVRFIKRMNLATGVFSRVIGGSGGDCAQCNRLRLSCDGFVRPCLFSDMGFSVRLLGAETAICKAVQAKPRRGDISTGTFNSIGG